MDIFYHLELLPFAYLLVLAWVVFANILAKLLGNSLVKFSPTPFQQFLSYKLHFSVTGDEICDHVFEKQLLNTIHQHLIVNFLGDFARWLSTPALATLPIAVTSRQSGRYPEIFWSGCPPNR